MYRTLGTLFSPPKLLTKNIQLHAHNSTAADFTRYAHCRKQQKGSSNKNNNNNKTPQTELIEDFLNEKETTLAAIGKAN